MINTSDMLIKITFWFCIQQDECMTWPQRLGFVNLQMSLLTVCLTMLADPTSLSTQEWGVGPSVMASWPAHADPLLQPGYQPPCSFREQLWKTYIPESKRAASAWGQWCWQCILLSFPSLGIPFFQQAGGHMWSKEQEGGEKSFLNWILGPQDEMCPETAAWETIIQVGCEILERGKKISWDNVTAVLGLI